MVAAVAGTDLAAAVGVADAGVAQRPVQVLPPVGPLERPLVQEELAEWRQLVRLELALVLGLWLSCPMAKLGTRPRKQ